MKKITNKDIVQALSAMEKDLEDSKDEAEGLKNQVKDVEPDDLVGEELPLENDENDENENEEEKSEKPENIKTPDQAKKVLNEATEDIQNVIDALDGLIGQTKEEETKASLRRLNDRYASDLKALRVSAEATINDTKDCISHWSFLSKISRKSSKSLSTTLSSKDIVENVKEAHKMWNILGSIFGGKKEATAVPPTGAKFTGDKFEKGKNPAEIELRHWHAGADEFDRDKKKEDNQPNPAIDDRLIDEGNPHDTKPFVNASFVFVPNNKYASYWDIFDSKTNRRIQASFANLPSSLFEDLPAENRGKTDTTFNIFAAKGIYGSQIVTAVTERGLGQVQKELNGRSVSTAGFTPYSASDKSTIRKYYSDAYGDTKYAKELTLGGEASSKGDIGYKPERCEVKEEIDERKQGPGKISRLRKRADKEKKLIDQLLTTIAAAVADIVEREDVFDIDSSVGWVRNLIKDIKRAIQEGVESGIKEDDLILTFDNWVDITEGWTIKEVKQIKDLIHSIYQGNTKASFNKRAWSQDVHIEENEGDGEINEYNEDEKGKRSLDPRVVAARSQKAIEVARKCAAAGIIPFTKNALLRKGAELMRMSSAKFQILDDTLEQMPIYNEAALKEAHIPDTETGIVGNTAEGVSNPKSSVDTEDLNSNVRSDAKITSSSFVPQIQHTSGRALDLSGEFTTTVKALEAKGVLDKVRQPKYKSY